MSNTDTNTKPAEGTQSAEPDLSINTDTLDEMRAIAEVNALYLEESGCCVEELND